jgi:hypothetical protein
MSAGYPPSNGQQRGPAGYPGAGGFVGPGGPAGPAGWNGDPGHGAPAWQPPGGPGQSGYPDYGYPSADGYGQTVNGGEYAYVISDNATRVMRPANPRDSQPPAAPPRRRTREERMQARPTEGTRSITAGGAEQARAANPPVNANTNANPPVNANASGAYGRDDPAYGPPPPGWSHRDRPIEDVRGAGQLGGAEKAAAVEHAGAPAKADQVVAEPARADQLNAEQRNAEQLKAEQFEADQFEEAEQAATPPPAAPDHQAVRGPFEPLVEHDRQPSGAAADHPVTDADGRPYEFPGLDDDAPAGSADAALDRLKELHRTAAAVAPQSLDAHFDQLLERQRRLISEYINESEGPSAPARDSGDDSLVGFGGDFTGSR